MALPQILDLCDRIVGEPGRRRHLFGWLRAPGAAADEWLAVDSYYPSRRLVVVCDDAPDALVAERVPEHGLRLLTLSPHELGGDLAAARVALERRLAELVPAPVRARADAAPPARPSVASHAAAPAAAVSGPSGQSRAAAAERAARFVTARYGAPVSHGAPPRQSAQVTRPVGISVAVVAALVLLVALAVGFVPALITLLVGGGVVIAVGAGAL